MTKTANKTFEESFSHLITAEYSRVRSERTKRGMLRAVENGYYPNRPPIGYSKASVKGLYVLNQDGIWLHNVLGAFSDDRINTREAIALVTALLQTRRGKQPTKRQVLKLMLNPYYAGYITWNGKTYKGKHTPIISETQHSMIRAQLNLQRALLTINRGE